MRIGFLFNHDQAHQVAHSLPIALAMACEPDAPEVVVAVTNERLADEVLRLGGDAFATGRLTLRRLGLRTPARRLFAHAAGRLIPAAKLLVYGDNLDFFASLDMLVVTEKTSLMLKSRHRLDGLRLVHTRHGAGDRAIGFDKASARFDLVLVAGPKIRDRLIADAGVPPDRIRMVGYPKFDIAPTRRPPFDDPADTRPIVLYNPHLSPHLSSWYTAGRAVLDWFVDHPEYRLIFAPHVMLFHRRLVLTIDRLRIDRPGTIDRRVLDAPNIHVDLGSAASTDMTYTEAADIYLGDVSSQIYEFLRRPRPCAFIDMHTTDWRGDPSFAHWAAGPVIRDVARLGDALTRAVDRHAGRFAPIQQRLIERTFDITDEPSSQRAARAIVAFADRSPHSRPVPTPAPAGARVAGYG